MMGRKPRINVEDVRRLAADGLSQATIALVLGCTRERIRQLCNQHGIETLSGLVDYDKHEAVARMVGEGLFNSEIAEALGTTVSAVRDRLRAIGLRANQPFDRDRIARLRALAAAGLSQVEAAREMGLDKSQVNHDAKNHGIRFRDGRTKNPVRGGQSAWSLSSLQLPGASASGAFLKA